MSAPKEYKVRLGTINSGRSYETHILAFVSLKCCLRNLEHFWIASNVQECGDFDDVVLFKKEKNKKAVISSLKQGIITGITYLIQVKHQDVSKDLTRKEILVAKGKKYRDFCLEKYLDSCLKLSEEVVKQSMGRSDIIDHLKQNPEIVFVLFTNRNVGRGLDFLEQTRSRGELLNVTGNIYRFKSEELNISTTSNDPRKSFIDKIFLYVKQPHIKEINNEINKLFKTLVGGCLSELVKDLQLDEILRRFLFYIEEWSKGLLDGHYPLTKTIILSKITEILLEPFTANLNVHLAIPEEDEEVKYNLWDEMIKNKDLIVINDSEKSVDDFMERFVCKLVDRHKELVQNSTTIKKNLMRTPGKPQLDSWNEYYEYLWKTKQIPLIIKVFSEREVKEVTEILSRFQGIFQIVILNRSSVIFKFEKSPKTFLTVSDLTDDQQEKLYSLPIKLQGRNFPSYKQLNLEMKWELTTKDILYILCNKFNIGQEFEELPEVFVNISLKRVWLEPKVLSQVTRDTFIIACVSIENFRKFFRRTIWNGDNLEVTEWNDKGDFNFNHHRILLCKNVVNLNDIQYFVNQNRNRSTHFLKFHDNFKLEWVRSWGTVKYLKEFRTSEKFAEKPVLASDAIINFCTARNPILICANPGMGKSVFVDYFARNAPTDFWVLKINLSKFKAIYGNFMNESESDFNLEAVFEKILEEECKENLSLAKAVFARFQKSKNIAAVLDAFDEISLNYQKWARRFIESLIKSEYFVLITTRPVFKNDLELLLDTLSLDLNLLTRKYQKYFLENYFSRYSGITCTTDTRALYVESLLNAAGINLNDHDNEFTGVPLQTLLLAEVLMEDYRKFVKTKKLLNKHFDLLYLYRHFIQKKVKVACEKSGEISEDIKHLYKRCKSFYALRLLFSEEDLSELQIDLKLEHGKSLFPHMLELLQKDGIMVAETEATVRFIHKTFAEYIAGEWLSENIENDNKIVAKRLLKATFDPKLRVVRNIFDRIIAKNCPLHLAIINFQMDQIASLIDSEHFNDLDRCNRHCVHLLAAWGFQHPQELSEDLVGNFPKSYAYVKRMAAKDEMASVLNSIPSERLRNCSDHILGYTPLDYAIISYSFHIANMLCSKMENPRVSINVLNLSMSFLLDYCKYVRYYSLEHVLINHTSIDSRLFIPEDQNSFSYIISKGYAEHLAVLLAGTKDINTSDKFGLTPLHVAVRTTRENIVEILLRNGADTNASDNSGKTPLHWSAIEGNLNILRLLITNGANLNIVDNNKRTALHYAIISCPQNKIQIVSELLNTILYINDVNERTPLTWAAYLGYTECVKLFLEMDIDIKQKNIAFQSAAVNKNLKTADLLLSNGADINSYQDGDTSLVLSAFHGNADVLYYLLDKGYDIESAMFGGMPALCWAALLGHKDFIKLLLSRGVDIESKDEQGRSSLYWAARCGHEDVVRLLLSKGANINTKDDYDDEPLNFAVRKGHTHIVKQLLSKGLEISEKSLLLAARCGHTDLINYFLSLNIDVNSKNVEGWTALHGAAECGQNVVVTLLLYKGAEIEVQNCRGETPLISAVKEGRNVVVNLLLSEGADIETVTLNNETPLIVSAKHGQNEITELLISKCSQIQFRCKEGKTAFHWAVGNPKSTLKTIELFLSKSVNLLELRTATEETPLILAAQGGSEGIVKLLLSKNANTEAKDQSGMTALHWASANGNANVVLLLLQSNANLEEKDNEGMTALIHAALSGDKEVTSVLLLNGANLTVRDANGSSALEYAKRCNHEDVMQLLKNSSVVT